MTVDLRGKVIDDVGDPLASKTVELWEAANWETPGSRTSSTTTDSDGLWAFDAQDATKVWIVVVIDGTKKFLIDARNRIQLTKLDLITNLNVDTINEHTSGSGVTIDGVKLKDSNVELAAGTAPAGTIVYINHDNAGDLNLNALTGKVVNIVIAGTDTAVFSASGLNLAASDALSFGGVNILADSSGTLTLSNVDALDATTEATIEAAIDTLANLTAASALVTVGTITTGVWNGTDINVADGGTGVGTFTDGGVLLGSGTGAITAMTVLADGEFIVGDGTTDPVAESGATVRTSLGLGTAAVLALAQADQAAVEAETNQDTYIPPDLLKHMPGAAKCWVNLNGVGTIANRASYNVASISDVGVGRYGVTIATDFSSANYVIAGSVQDTLADDNAVTIKGGGTQAAGSFEVRTTFDDGTTGVPASYDMTYVYIVAFGDQ